MLGVALAVTAGQRPTILPQNVTVIRSGDIIAIRTPWTASHDLVQKLSLNIAGTDTFNDAVKWMASGTGTITKATPDSGAIASSFATTYLNPDDDNSPFFAQYGYLGGNHAQARLKVVTAAGHGKTTSDLGSIWADSAGSPKQFVLVKIISSSVLWFLGTNAGSATNWNFNQTLTGPTLTHVSGAANTGAVTIGSQAGGQMHPGTRNTLKSVLLNGSKPVTADGIYKCAFVDLVHEYDVLNSHVLLNYITANPGVAVDWRHSSVTAAYRVKHRYRYHENGSVSDRASFTAVIPAVLSSGGYIGGIQARVVSPPASGTQWRYVPRMAAFTISSTTYNLSQPGGQQITTIPSGFDLTAARWSDPNLPPNRFLNYAKTSGGSRHFGLAIGWDPLYGAAIDATLKAGAASVLNIATSGKMYPKLATPASVSYPGSIAAGQTLNWVSYRLPVNFSAHSDLLMAEWYEANDGFHLAIEAESALTTTVQLPTWFAGKRVTVIDGLVSTSATVPINGQLSITTSAATSALLKIK